MIVGLLILAGLVVLVVFLARNMMPARSEGTRDVDDLTSGYGVDPGSHHCGDHSFDGGDGGSH